MVRKKTKEGGVLDARDLRDPAMRMDHDPEDLVSEGMATEAAEVDKAETLASTGDAEGAFREIVSGSATGTGVDRVEPDASSMREEAREASPGSDAFAEKLGASPDIDENDGDDSWLQDLPEDLK
jgi:hypothetical protein